MPVTPCTPTTLISYPNASACAVNQTARISAIALLRLEAFDFDDDAWENLNRWQTGIASVTKDIVLITPVRGGFAEPAEQTTEGDGFTRTITTGRDYDIQVQHNGTDEFMDFYDRLNQLNQEYGAAFIFPDLTAFVAVGKDKKLIPVTFNARPMSEQSLSQVRQFMINSRWSSFFLPDVRKVPAGLFPGVATLPTPPTP